MEWAYLAPRGYQSWSLGGVSLSLEKGIKIELSPTSLPLTVILGLDD